MLHFIYAGDYDDTDETERNSPILTNAQVHTIADKYDVPGLADLALAKFRTQAEKGWDTDDFASAIQEVYTVAATTKSELQQKVVTVACDHADALYAKEDSLFQEVSKEQFASNHYP